MLNIFEVNETNKMIEEENLDVRTITLGISLLDCIDNDLDTLNKNIYEKITRLAKDLSWSKTTARPGMVVATGHMEQM